MEYATLEDELIHEVWRQDIAAIKRLLAAGANPNLPGGAWASAIACAGQNDETGDVARVLVEAGADINIQDGRGLTPLHQAVDTALEGTIQSGGDTIDWSVVEVFLAIGANPVVADSDGETVFDLATAYGYIARKSFDEFMHSRNSVGQTTSGQRLAQYLHCEESDLGKEEAPRSSMTFWSLFTFGTYCGPKPSSYIRRLLQRIHYLVHGDKNRSQP